MTVSEKVPGPQGRAASDANAPIAQRLARGGVWVFLNRVLVAVTQLITLGLLARLMSPEEMGVYFLISNLVIIGSIFVQVGIPQVIIKKTAESLEVGSYAQTRSVVLTCLSIGLISALCFFLVFVVFGVGDWLAMTVFDSPLMGQVMIFAVLWLLVQSIQRIVGETFRGLHDMRLAAIFGGMFSGVLSTILFVLMKLVYGECSIYQAVLIFLFSIGISFVVALFLLNRKVQLFQTADPLQFGPTIALAIPILLASLGNIILLRADIWILGMYVDEQQVALYGSAARLVGLLSTPLLMASAVLAPMIVQLTQQGEMKRLQKVVQLIPTIVAIPALVVIAVFVFWGGWLLELIYGDTFYTGAWGVLNLLAAGQVACLLAGVSIQILLMTHGQVWVMLTTIFCTVLAIVISVLSVDTYGITGVAAGFAIGIGMQSLLAIVLCRIKVGINTFVSVGALLNAKETIRTMREQNKKRREASVS